MINQLIATAVGSENENGLGETLALIAPPQGKAVEPWQLAALGGLLDALNRRGRDIESLMMFNASESILCNNENSRGL